MFELLIVKPIFNLLVLVYALLPGHNFGLSIILFTIIIRLLMWPLVKKQLHHAKAMKELQPELKRIKESTKGDRQRESLLTMQLYKEREISPFGSLGVLIVQVIILLGLYSGLRKVVDDPQALVDFAYPVLRDLNWLQVVSENIERFDATLLGFVDLTKAALPRGSGIYWPAMLLVIGSAVTQYFQSRQLMPDDKDARGLRQILKDANSGKQADQAEVNAAVGRGTRFLIPALIFIFTVNLPSALGLYWFVSGLVAYWQQARILGQDKVELRATANAATSKKTNEVLEGEVVKPGNSKAKKAKKRRK